MKQGLTKLHPQTAHALAAFGSRRRRLLAVRALCWFLFTLVLGLACTAAADWLWMLSDETRWLMSLSSYAAALAVGTAAGYRLLLAPEPSQLARWVESLSPSLAGSLQSAVELASPGELDSPAFRTQLQKQVAEQVRSLRVEQLLPWRRVSRSLVLCAAGLAAMVLFLAWGQGPALVLLARAAAPWMQLDRVADTHVRILKPSPRDGYVPQGEPLVFAAQTLGQRVQAAVLELQAPGKASVLQPMTAFAADRFEAMVATEQHRMRYRIRAGQAVTAWHEVIPQPRPSVQLFEKTYTPPAYTRQAVRTVQEAAGHLEGLVDSRVDLVLKLDQRVSQARIECLMQDGHGSTEPSKAVTVTADGLPGDVLRASLPLSASGRYRVQAVSEKTGLDNPHSAWSEILVRTDGPPQLQWQSPGEGQWAQVDDLLPLRARASDDVGLQAAGARVRVNAGKWIDVPLALQAGAREADLSQSLDLLPMKLREGDQVTLQLRVQDLKGQWAQGPMIKVPVASEGVTAEHRLQLQQGLNVQQAIERLAARAAELASTASQQVQAMQASGDLDARHPLELVDDAAAMLEQEADRTLEVISRALASGAGAVQTTDLMLLARGVARVRHEAVPAARVWLAATPQGNPSSKEADAFLSVPGVQKLGHAGECLKRASEWGEHLAKVSGVMLAQHEAAALCVQLTTLERMSKDSAQAQQRTAELDPGQTARLPRRIELLQAQVRQMSQWLEAIAAHHAPETARAQQIAKRLEPLQKGADATRTQAPNRELEHLRRASNILRDAQGQGQSMLMDTSRLAESLRSDMIERMPGPYAQIMVLRELPAGPLADRAWDGVIAQSLLWARYAATTKDADAHWPADLSLLAAVLKHHKPQAQAKRSQELASLLEQVAAAASVLETGHRVHWAQDQARRLGAEEAWVSRRGAAVLAHALLWRTCDPLAAVAIRRLKQHQITVAAQRLESALQSPEFRRCASEMEQRIRRLEARDSLTQEFAFLQQAWDQAAAETQPLLEQARQKLRSLLPTPAQQLEQLAQQVEQSQRIAQELAQSPAANDRAVAQAAQQAKQPLEKVDEHAQAVALEAERELAGRSPDLERWRDAQDIAVMLQESADKARQAWDEAAQAPTPEARNQSLQQAQQEQAELARRLRLAAQHEANAERGEPQITRPSLRSAEAAAGVDKALDEAIRRLQQTQQLAQTQPQSPQQSQASQQSQQLQQSQAVAEQLREQARQDRAMRQELARLAQGHADAAAQELAKARRQQAEVIKDIEQSQAKRSSQISEAQQKIDQLREQARKLAAEPVAGLKQSSAAHTPEAQAALEAASQSLQAAAKQAGEIQASDPAAPAALEKLAAPLQAAAEQLQSAKEQLSMNRDATAAKEPERAAAAEAGAKQASEASAQSSQLARQAQQLSQALQRGAEQQQKRMKQLAKAEAGVLEPLLQAAAQSDLAAADHETAGDALEASAQRALSEAIRSDAQEAVQQAEATLAQGESAEQSLAAARKAAESLDALGGKGTGADDRSDAAAQSPAGDAPQPVMTASDPQSQDSSAQASRWKARWLDQQQQQQQQTPSSKGKSGQAPAQGPRAGDLLAQSAAAEAMREELAALRAAAKSSSSSSSNSGSDATTDGAMGSGQAETSSASGKVEPQAPTPGEGTLPARHWARLQASANRDLSQVKGQGITGPYRDSVDAYFRAVAQRARQGGRQP